MNGTLADLDAWLSEPESERLEFKEAKANFHFETLARYCAALANEGGGKVILGVTDKRPRRVVGSTASKSPVERSRAWSNDSGFKSLRERSTMQAVACLCSIFLTDQSVYLFSATVSTGHAATNSGRFLQIACAVSFRKRVRISRQNSIPMLHSAIWTWH